MNKNAYALRTSALLRASFEENDLPQFVEAHANEMKITPFAEYITDLCDRQEKSRATVIDGADLDRGYGYKLFKGTQKNPSRDVVLRLAFSFGADVETTQEMLKVAAHFMLYARNLRDFTILHCIHDGENLSMTQAVLSEMGLEPIGGNKDADDTGKN